jgi:hypothetical protein
VAVGLTTMTGGPGYYGVMEIGDPGSYQVRVCRRSGDDAGNRWLVQFWPADDVPSPQWLVRRRRTTPGWAYQLTDPATVTQACTPSAGHRTPPWSLPSPI